MGFFRDLTWSLRTAVFRLKHSANATLHTIEIPERSSETSPAHTNGGTLAVLIWVWVEVRSRIVYSILRMYLGRVDKCMGELSHSRKVCRGAINKHKASRTDEWNRVQWYHGYALELCCPRQGGSQRECVGTRQHMWVGFERDGPSSISHVNCAVHINVDSKRLPTRLRRPPRRSTERRECSEGGGVLPLSINLCEEFSAVSVACHAERVPQLCVG